MPTNPQDLPKGSFALIGFDVGFTHCLEAIYQALSKQQLESFYNVGTISPQPALKEAFRLLLSKGVHPILIGTDSGMYHEIPKPCTFVHCGAKLPLMEPYPEDTTCFGIQRTPTLAKQGNILYADEFHVGGSELSLDVVDDILARSQRVFVSIDLSVFAAPFAPEVLEPQIMGLLPWDLTPALQRLAASGKVVALSLTGLLAEQDPVGLTAQLAAYLIKSVVWNTNTD